MEKIIYSEEEFENKLLIGIKKTINILGKTLGPKGRHVIYEKFGNINIVDDGTTIADEIIFEDSMESAVAKIIAKTSKDSNNIVGDGSTTTALLTCEIVLSGLKYKKLGFNPVFIRKGLDKVITYLIVELAQMSKHLVEKEEIRHIARIASSDSDIGDLIAEAIEKVGSKGIVSVQEGNSFETTIETSPGIELDKGLFSPYLSNNAEKNEFFANNVAILITDQTINTSEQMFRILEVFSQTQKSSLLIITEDIKPEPLLLLIANKFKKGLNVCLIKTPSFGENRRLLLEDLCIITGAELIAKDKGINFSNINLKHFGIAESVNATNNKTTIVSSSEFESIIKNRQLELELQLKNINSKFDIDKLKDRIAKLTGNIAVIHVGASTEVEMKSKKLKIEDALNATKAASEEGIIPGGGITLINLINKLKDHKLNLIGDEKCAIDILSESLLKPCFKIIENSGLNPELVIGLMDKSNQNNGFDVTNLEYVNMLTAGIIDPTKVLRIALQTSSSTAGMLLTSDSAILENKKNTVNNSNQYPGEVPY
jgi:chaperonin GroEL